MTGTTHSKETLMIRIGYAPRQGRVYFQPHTVMQEYLRFSKEHDNHVLWKCGIIGVMKNVEQVILYAHDEGLMLIGEVTGFGSPYNPRTWDEGSFYQCPKPWSKEPAKYWIALDNLRPLEGFNPDLYELAAGKDKGKPLSLVFERKVPMLTMADAEGKRKSATTSRRSGLTRIRLREV